MAKPFLLLVRFIVWLFIFSCWIFAPAVTLRPWDNSISLDVATRLRFDPASIRTASSDYGKLVHVTPAAVFYPSSVEDISDLVKLSYNSSAPFTIAARGAGHSVRAQAMAHNGVVVAMASLKDDNISMSWSPSIGFYADVGGEWLWIDVLQATVEHGVAPVSWTDYLYLSVGGTLSNAGISGQSYKYGPQISNVHEMDVITGKGEMVTCSKHENHELFFAVLGGLGQFGIITRARIALEKAPSRVKWIRMLYDDFSTFTKDQEHLISINGLDYLEGSLIFNQGSANDFRSSSFSSSSDDQNKITSLLAKHGIIYCLEVVKYYDDLSIDIVDKELQWLLQGLSFLPGFMFKKDASLFEFLNRVRSGELELQSKGQWEVPHPWLNLFVPKSRIRDFYAGVIVDIVYRRNMTTGTFLVYPTSREKWDERTSAVTPDEDIFYNVALLQSSSFDDWRVLDSHNNEILEYCYKAGIKIKQYLPHYSTRGDWMKHFGSKWNIFHERKARFDPKMILSPGQKIFNN